MKRYAVGLDFGTESARAIVVDCETGLERAQAVNAYAHGVITERLPGGTTKLPADFALQHAQDYLDSARLVIGEVLKLVSPQEIVGIGVDFTACTVLPVLKDGTPVMSLPEFAQEPHAWVKLWKHHAAQPEANEVNALAHRRDEKFLQYYSEVVSSEWMLPKCLEIARRAPAVYDRAAYIMDAGDWIVQRMTGVMTRNSCAAGYKGLWNEELGFVSPEFLAELDPRVKDLRDKWLQNIVAPGTRVGGVSAAFAQLTGLQEGTPVSAATIDAHSGVAGMGVYREGPLSIIMGTSSCHMVLSRELRLFNGYAGVAKDGILPGFYGYESGQSAVGDIFAWFAKKIAGESDFSEISRKAAALEPGASGLMALDWMNGNRSVLMNADLSGMILGLTLSSRPEEIYRSLIEASAYGTRVIVESYRNGGVPVQELVVCGGLTQDPLIMQIYADVTGLPLKVAASTQAVALGSAVFGALAAGRDAGGFATAEEAIVKMTCPPSASFLPNAVAVNTYEELYRIYRRVHDLFGREHAEIMMALKKIKGRTL